MSKCQWDRLYQLFCMMTLHQSHDDRREESSLKGQAVREGLACEAQRLWLLSAPKREGRTK